MMNVSLHEDSKQCKYSVMCEHNYCMLKHENKNYKQVRSAVAQNKKDGMENLECNEEDNANLEDIYL